MHLNRQADRCVRLSLCAPKHMQIVSTRSTRTYSPRTRRESIYGIPLWNSNVSPRSVIQRKSQSIIPGECWAFEGAVGYLLIGLVGTIRVMAVTYEHIPLSMSPDGHLNSAPKLFQLWVGVHRCVLLATSGL